MSGIRSHLKIVEVSIQSNDTTKSVNCIDMSESCDEFSILDPGQKLTPQILINNAKPSPRINVKEMAIQTIAIENSLHESSKMKTPKICNYATRTRLKNQKSFSVNTYLQKYQCREEKQHVPQAPKITNARTPSMNTPTRGRKRPLYFNQHFVTSPSDRSPQGVITSVAKRVRSTPEAPKCTDALKFGTPKRLFNSTPKQAWSTPITFHTKKIGKEDCMIPFPVNTQCIAQPSTTNVFNGCIITHISKPEVPTKRMNDIVESDSPVGPTCGQNLNPGWFTNVASKAQNFFKKNLLTKNPKKNSVSVPSNESKEDRQKLKEMEFEIKQLKQRLEDHTTIIEILTEYEKKRREEFRQFKDELILMYSESFAKMQDTNQKLKEELILIHENGKKIVQKIENISMPSFSTRSFAAAPPPPPPPPPPPALLGLLAGPVSGLHVDRVKKLERSNTMPSRPCITIDDIRSVKLKKTGRRSMPSRKMQMKSEINRLIGNA